MVTNIWRKKQEELNIEDVVLLLQKGSEWSRDDFLKKHESLIKVFTSTVCKRYVDASDEEYSIGLLAFNEAIDQFQVEYNKKFLGFAEIVVRRRVIDYIKKEKRNQVRNVLFEAVALEEEVSPQWSMDSFKKETEMSERKEEIERYELVLADFGLGFEELTKLSPKHRDARKSAADIAELIVRDDHLKYHILEKKTLPIKELLVQSQVSKSTLERQRKYILSLVLLLVGEYQYLKDYLPS